MSLPITARQLRALRALQSSHPDLAELASTIALAFDSSRVENPQMARLILEKTCWRILNNQPGSYNALFQHLEHFATLGCLSSDLVAELHPRIQKLANALVH